MSSEFPELPIHGQRPERADAAANRRRILCAARALLAECGPEGLTMQAVAARAGVGKGTLFRRFGDRAGLTAALADDSMRAFQQAFLHGPPPLGPGAPAADRLEAFVVEVVRQQDEHQEFILAGAGGGHHAGASVYGALLVHIASLVRELHPEVDERVLAALILNALSPWALYRMRQESGVDTAGLQAAARALVAGLGCVPPPGYSDAVGPENDEQIVE